MSLDLPGFADPVAGAQATFRAVLDAMARPGRILRAGSALTPPAPLCHAAAGLLLTLADADTRLLLAPDFAPARDWIAFHCGANFTADPCAAHFALATALPEFSAFNAGSDEAPEDSATLILQVADFVTGAAFHLSGPGIRESTTLRVNGLPGDFVASWHRNHALFPRGIDLVLCAGDELVALPRSVAVA